MNALLKNEIHQQARQAAILFLNTLETTDFVGPTLERTAEIKNVALIYDQIDDPEAEGFSAQKQGQKFIFINSNFNQRLQKFTIAHEIFHLSDDIQPLKIKAEDERAADHFAANVLLPEKVVFDKIRALERLENDELAIFFNLADLAQVPYETLYKRYEELGISNTFLKKEMEQYKLGEKDPYLKVCEQKLQRIRANSMMGLSEFDQPTQQRSFEALARLENYFKKGDGRVHADFY